ncbi:MAG: competence/damage-inducible protein A [Candidatus Helarchaeota archaeon]
MQHINNRNSMLVEIINTGNELLIGKVKNTNIEWLIKRLAKLGARLIQYSVIPDDVDVIAATLKAALSRTGDIILITGGLGATYDDMTLAAVVKVLKKPLVLDERALQMVESKFDYAKRLGWTQADEITNHWKKMATIPEGSIPLENPPGAAPGVQIHYNGKMIFCLPGPPNELKSIFRKAIQPIIKKSVTQKSPETHLFIKGIIEPTISGIIHDTFQKFEGVWIKSHPMLHTGKLMLEIHFTLQEGYSASEIIESAKTYFINEIKKLGRGRILSADEVK